MKIFGISLHKECSMGLSNANPSSAERSEVRLCSRSALQQLDRTVSQEEEEEERDILPCGKIFGCKVDFLTAC